MLLLNKKKLFVSIIMTQIYLAPEKTVNRELQLVSPVPAAAV